MPNLFTPNIDRKGRIVRAIGGVIALVGAGFGLRVSPWLAGVLGAAGIFMLFEAKRGWCGLRACGLKTKL